MQILVFNGGSSSLSYKIFEVKHPDKITKIFEGKAHRVGVKGTQSSYIENCFNGKKEKQVVAIPDHGVAAALAIQCIQKENIQIDYIGHRFVHGGNYFKKSALINASNLKKLKLCLSLAPLHNPISLSVIEESLKLFSKDTKQFVAIDSAFHSTIPREAYQYALPQNIIDRYQFRKYGFHGLSYTSIVKDMPQFLNGKLAKSKIIACHLGTGGASITAIKNGHSIDSSMGFSPQSGLIMSTRAGDIDPWVILHLIKKYGYSLDKLIALLNKESGLLGISGFSSDITDIIAQIADKKNGERAALAIQMYVQRVKKYIGSFIISLGGDIDALVFTDDIGFNCPFIRNEICREMQWAGIEIDQKRNNAQHDLKGAVISSSSSKVKVLCVPTKEEEIICYEGMKLMGGVK